MSYHSQRHKSPRRPRPPIAPVAPVGDANGHLLYTLFHTLGDGFSYRAFDASMISGQGYWEFGGQLREALRFLDVRWKRANHHLYESSHSRVDKWLRRVEGRDIGGFRLERDRIGWCRIGPAIAVIHPRRCHIPGQDETPVIGRRDTPIFIGFDR